MSSRKLPDKRSGEKGFYLNWLNIGPRLTLCFFFIVLAMLVGNAILLWQFHSAQLQAERLSGVDQELIVVLQAHTNLMSFYERLETLAQSQATTELLTEAEPLRNALFESNQRSRNALSRLPPEVQSDPTLLPSLQAIQDALPAELEAITVLAKSGDWQAVRLRLANQVRPLESRNSVLVENIDREVSEKRAQALLKIEQAQRRILLIVSITAAFTLAFAAFLGLVITRSITRPLGRLIEGSKALMGGDFSHRVPAAGKDEIALLGNVFNDMIERLQQLYRELKSRESYLAEAQELSRTGSLGWDVSSREFYWSAETFRIFEYESTEKASMELVLERIHPEDRSAVKQLMERASREKTAFDMEPRLLMPNGSVKYTRVVGHPSKDERGSFEFVGAVIDITERELAEQALRQAQAELEHASRVTGMGELTASLAHEVNQPIAAAITNANTCIRWLARDTPNVEEAQAAAVRIVNDGARAAEIVKRTRLLFKKGNAEREPIDINDVIREMGVLLRAEATRYSISFRTELAAELPRVMGDRVRLQQVLMNLVLNSFDAMNDVTGTRELVIKSERSEDGQVLVSISDTGVGLPPKQGERIFDAFFTTKDQGTGMGLRISRSIVESHGGRLWACDNSPRGAIFSFTLPSNVEA